MKEGFMENSHHLHKALFVFMFLAMLLMQSCLDNQMMTHRGKNGRFHTVDKKSLNGQFKFRVCINYQDQKTDSFYTAQFRSYSKNGFSVVCVNEESQDILARLTAIAERVGLELDHEVLADKHDAEEEQNASYANLEVAELSPTQFQNQIELAMANGVKGISVFDSADLTGEHLKVIATLSRKSK